MLRVGDRASWSLVALLFATPAFAAVQEPAATDPPATEEAPAAKSGDSILRELMMEAQGSDDPRAAMKEGAERALKDNEEMLSSGDGLHWRGILNLYAGNFDAGFESLVAHAEAQPKSELAAQSLMVAAQIAPQTKSHRGETKAVLAKIDRESLSDEMKQNLEQFEMQLESDAKREALSGNPAPTFTATHVVNGPETFALEDLKGKVVLLDFFATWCPPCRAVVPELVALQDEYREKGVQVVAVTKFYGYGMDFADPEVEKPHGGERVGGRGEDRLTPEAELQVNQNFAKAFELNYPLVFVDESVSDKDYMIEGIPTVYVLDREGKIVGHVVGGGEESHATLVELVKKALGES